jgi:hypothetical protein
MFSLGCQASYCSIGQPHVHACSTSDNSDICSQRVALVHPNDTR